MNNIHYVYARICAILTRPPTHDADDVYYFFASKEGETQWPCDALHFDTQEEASLAIAEHRMRMITSPSGDVYPKVVALALTCDIVS